MPLPLNQSTNRLWIGVSAAAGVSAAYAVPVELNIETNGGKPTTTCEPTAVSPFRMARRVSLTRLVITCDMDSTSRIRKLPQPNHRDDHLFKAELRLTKLVQDLAEHRAVRRRLEPPRRVAEVLLHHAFLALRALRQHRAELGGRRELRVRNAGHIAGRVDVEIDGLHGAATAAFFSAPASRRELQAELLAPGADAVEPLQPKADRVDQLVAGIAARVDGVLRHPLAVGLR